MQLDLSALGITEDSLTKAVLSQLGMTPEQAVKALAERLGVKQSVSETGSIKSGDTVSTADGAARAFILKGTDLAALANAGRILSGLSGLSGSNGK